MTKYILRREVPIYDGAGEVVPNTERVTRYFYIAPGAWSKVEQARDDNLNRHLHCMMSLILQKVGVTGKKN